MPVPAPRSSQQPAHPIYKPAHVAINQHRSFDRLDSPHLLTPFHHFSYNFVSHTSNSSSIARGGPNALVSLPPGRLGALSNSFFDVETSKPHRVSLPLSNERTRTIPSFIHGLTDAPSVSISKSAFAKANCPPVSAIYSPTHCLINPAFLGSSELISNFDHGSGRSDNSYSQQVGVGDDSQSFSRPWNNSSFQTIPSSQDISAQYVLGCNGPLDSTLIAAEGTPFEDFVDHAVTDGLGSIPIDLQISSDSDPGHRQQSAQMEPSLSPAAMQAYRVKAEPISEWIAAYVRNIIAGSGLHNATLHASDGLASSSAPTPHLARSICSLLCSTLLQPSAIILALWYISRLPVAFTLPELDPVMRMNELLFRQELLGSGHPQLIVEEGQLEFDIPFRLILLGCMLANKWLDDHTFSNKTWHAISELPLERINKLELLALNLLGHDLSISRVVWEAWLIELRPWNHPPSFRPSPIERPSTSDPKTIVRNLIDKLLVASGHRNVSRPIRGHPEPVFVGLADRVGEKDHFGLSETDLESADIDLDEDGPLREEYLPQRRPSHRRAVTSHHVVRPTTPIDSSQHRGSFNSFVPHLPPPAKWSPEADPPMERERDKTKDRYIAVRASANDMPQELSGHPSAQLLTLSLGQLFNHSTHILTSAQWLLPPYQLR